VYKVMMTYFTQVFSVIVSALSAIGKVVFDYAVSGLVVVCSD